MRILLTIQFTAFLFGQCDAEIAGNIQNAMIGDTVVLSCHVNGITISRRWRKNNTFITDESEVNKLASGHERRKIINYTNKFYNLEISNVLEPDFGDYWCELQTSGDVLKFDTVLIQSKEPSYLYSTDNSGENTYTEKQMSSIFVLGKNNSATTGIYPTEKVTRAELTEHPTSEHQHLEITSTLIITTLNYNQDKKDSGSSTRDIFYYGIIAAGFALMLFLSIGCNICIIRRCKTIVLKTNTTEDRRINKEEEENPFEMGHIEELNSLSSLYETINESEMLKDPLTSPSTNRQDTMSLETHLKPESISYLEVIGDCPKKEAKHTVQVVLEQPYLDVIDNDVYLQRKSNQEAGKDKETGNSININMTSGSLKSLHYQFQGTMNKLKLETKTHSKSMTDINCYNEDVYLNPYVPLITNEMEYTSSYSLPILTDDRKENVGIVADSENLHLYNYPETSVIISDKIIDKTKSSSQKIFHINSSETSSSDSEITPCKDDAYLNPYIPLITNEMEYTHSYSHPFTLSDRDIGTNEAGSPKQDTG